MAGTPKDDPQPLIGNTAPIWNIFVSCVPVVVVVVVVVLVEHAEVSIRVVIMTIVQSTDTSDLIPVLLIYLLLKIDAACIGIL
jgi:hypothetical protein